MARKHNSIVPLADDQKIRFWGKVGPENENGCQLWTGTVAHNDPLSSYGQFIVTTEGVRRYYTATRLAYFMYHDIDPGDLLVCHTCDIPRCIAKAHLFLGTDADNMQDAMVKGRKNPTRQMLGLWQSCPEKLTHQGESHPRSKLTEVQVREIRVRSAAGEGRRALGREYHVTRQAILAIHQRRLWKHI